MIITHAGCMLAGFFSMTAGITTALFMRRKRWWLRVHRRFGSVGAICVLLGFMTALFMVSRQTGRHFAVPHAWLGLATILSVLCTYTAGLMQFKIKTARVRSLHRWAGRGTFALMILNIVSGLFLAGIL
ncbi:MAG: hypothetical protein JXB09_05625 [Deltaproteobacteria bacterium]|nr:hypothetical protein [Deltaproteobacteria bacterium]